MGSWCWLRYVKSLFNTTVQPSRRTGQPRFRKLRFEELEARLAPATLTVNTTLDVVNPADGTLSLRDAISAIDAGNANGLTAGEQSQVSGTFGVNDTIQFALPSGSVITLNSSLPSVGPRAGSPLSSIQIIGPGAGALTVDGNHQFQVFNLDSIASTITNLTISNGFSTRGGGAIYDDTEYTADQSFFDSSVTVSGCVFTGNQDTSADINLGGGAIYCHGQATVTGCNFSNNQSDNGGSGGAMAVLGGLAFLTNCTFTDNSSTANGGAVLLQIQTPTTTSATCTNCTFSGNSSNQGGAFFVANGSDEPLLLTDSTLSQNEATNPNAQGGALLITGPIDIASCTFTQNSAVGAAGAIRMSASDGNNNTSSEISNCGFYSNSTGGSGGTGTGGAICILDGAVTIDSSVFVGNSAIFGGGIYTGTLSTSAILTLSNCTILQNSVPGNGYGGGIDNANHNGSAVGLDYTVVTDNKAGTGPNTYGNIGGANASGQFVTTLTTPASLGVSSPATISLEYTNTGATPLAAPLVVLTATQNANQGAFLTLDPSLANEGFDTSTNPPGFGQSVEILASGATGGTLAPGESETVPIYYGGWLSNQWDSSQPGVTFSLSLITPNIRHDHRLGVDGSKPAAEQHVDH